MQFSGQEMTKRNHQGSVVVMGKWFWLNHSEKIIAEDRPGCSHITWRTVEDE